MNAFGFWRGSLIGIIVRVSSANSGRRGIRRQTKAKVQLRGAVPHTFDSRCKAVNDSVIVGFLHTLGDPVDGIWGGGYRAAPSAHKIRTCGELGIIYRIADLTCDMTKVT